MELGGRKEKEETWNSMLGVKSRLRNRKTKERTRKKMKATRKHGKKKSCRTKKKGDQSGQM